MQVFRCCEEVKDHLKQLWLPGGKCALTPAGRIKKPGVTLLSMDCNGMAAHLNGSDCEGVQTVLYAKHSGWIG